MLLTCMSPLGSWTELKVAGQGGDQFFNSV